MASVYLRKLKTGPIYYGQVKRDGHWVTYNTGLTDRKLAEEHARITQWKLDRGEDPFSCPVPTKTVGDWGNEYLNAMARSWAKSTLVSRSHTLRLLGSLCGSQGLEAIERALPEFTHRNAHLSPHSQNIHIRNVRSFVRWVAERDPAFKHPRIKEVKAPLEAEHDYLSDSEITAILGSLAGRTLNGRAVEPFIRFVLLTGLRRGEAITARREWVRGGLIRVPASASKTDKPRLVPVTPELANLLESCPSEGRLWPGITIEVSRVFRAAVVAAGITRPIKFHNLRDTFIVRALRSGVPAPLVARIAGHNLRTMLSNYAHFAESDFADVTTRLLPLPK